MVVLIHIFFRCFIWEQGWCFVDRVWVQEFWESWGCVRGLFWSCFIIYRLMFCFEYLNWSDYQKLMGYILISYSINSENFTTKNNLVKQSFMSRRQDFTSFALSFNIILLIESADNVDGLLYIWSVELVNVFVVSQVGHDYFFCEIGPAHIAD